MIPSPLAQRGQRNQRRQRQQRQQRQPGAQPQAATATPARSVPERIVSHWIGVDRENLPRTGRQNTPDPQWMQTLLNWSDIRFTGAYVTGAALSGPGVNPGDFTNSSKDTSRAWMQNAATLAAFGYGFAFFYVGFSVGGGEPAPSTGLDRARGTLHGQHLRTIITSLGSDFAGAVVFIDNEDGESTTLTPQLIDYYSGLFAEMSRPDPQLAACRPGLYGHGTPLSTMLQKLNNLYLWDVNVETSTTTTPDAPFAGPLPIQVDSATRTIRPYLVTPPRGATFQPFVAWPTGRQFRFYTGNMPLRSVPPPHETTRWLAMPGWDFDSSFVRNPAFPEAEPRIATLKPGAAVRLVFATTFVRPSAGPPPVPAQSALSQFTSSAFTLFVPADGISIEPDAPLVPFMSGDIGVICTILTSGSFGITARSSNGSWSPLSAAGTTATPPLRRIRSIGAFSRIKDEITIFYVGTDHHIYVMRKQPNANWENAVAISALFVHPFGKIATSARGSNAYEVYFIDQQGLLNNVTFFAGGASSWPSFTGRPIETAPSLQPDGALAIHAPTADCVLVFGVGFDLRLSMGAWVAGQSFTGMQPVGQAQDLISPHTRLATNKIDDTTVEVAALTDDGHACIYQVQRSGTAWTAAPRTVLADPPKLTGPIPPLQTGTVMQRADGFRINPFGDLALYRDAGATSSTLLCAGVRGASANVLSRDIASGKDWQFFAS